MAYDISHSDLSQNSLNIKEKQLKESAPLSAIFSARSRRTKVVIIVLIVFLVALFSHQYFLFISEKDGMRHYLLEKQTQLLFITKFIKDREKAEQRMRELHRELSMARLLIPATLQVESFREDFERWAKASGVLVEDFSWREEEREFYGLAHCAVTLSGDTKGLANLWERKAEFERLVTWGEEESLDTGMKVKLQIYSTPWPERKEFDVDALRPKPCKEFTTGVWLWPFSKQIRKVQETLDHICPEIGEHAEEVRKIELLKSKAREVAYLSEVINHLTKSPQ